MGRPQRLEDTQIVSTRIETSTLHILHDLAALESINTGQKVTVQQLIRNALNYTYRDNDRMKEAFRRSRAHINKKFKY